MGCFPNKLTSVCLCVCELFHFFLFSISLLTLLRKFCSVFNNLYFIPFLSLYTCLLCVALLFILLILFVCNCNNIIFCLMCVCFFPEVYTCLFFVCIDLQKVSKLLVVFLAMGFLFFSFS